VDVNKKEYTIYEKTTGRSDTVTNASYIFDKVMYGRNYTFSVAARGNYGTSQYVDITCYTPNCIPVSCSQSPFVTELDCKVL
jgi:hypothetical protein